MWRRGTFVYLLKINYMKSVKLLFVLFLLSLTSCKITEDIYINENGSGKFALDMDASALMAMIPADSLGSDKPNKDIDSTFTFKELLATKKDSIARLSKEEQTKLKRLENFAMKIKMKSAEKQFAFSMTNDFKSVAELQDAMGALNELQNLNKQKQDAAMVPSGAFGSNNSDLKYTYTDKKFTRKATVKKELKRVENDSAADAYKMIYEASTYAIKYHFPKKVKKVSNSSALFSEDRKTVTIEYLFSDYMNDPEKLNFEVEFE